MTTGKSTRLSKLAKELNVGISTIIEFLSKKGFDVPSNPNAKVPPDAVDLLQKEYSKDSTIKKESEKIHFRAHRHKNEVVSIEDVSVEKTAPEENELPQEELSITDHSLSTPKKQPLEEVQSENEIVKEEKVVEKEKPVIEQPVSKIAEKQKEDVEIKKEGKPEKEESPISANLAISEESTETVQKAKPVVKKEVIKEKKPKKTEAAPEEPVVSKPFESEQSDDKVKVVGKIDLDSLNQRTRPPKKTRKEREAERQRREKSARETAKKQSPDEERKGAGGEVVRAKVDKLSGPTVVGKIDLPDSESRKGNGGGGENGANKTRKKKRKRIHKDLKDKVAVPEKRTSEARPERAATKKKTQFVKRKKPVRQEVTEEDVQKQIKETLARLTTKGHKSKGSKYRREKRQAVTDRLAEQEAQAEKEKNIIKVTEFVSVNELATMMNVPVTDVISTCMNLGMFVSINQRLDAETMSLVADEFGYEVQFISVEVQEAIEEEEDKPEDLISRPPIVTVMGHVDHGKTSLLDHIRKANVIAGEAGGITQHIGAYNVTLEGGRKISFLDTPGHEAFTAMRARGAQVTDIAIIIVAADDNVMPQTVEAINHASAAGVPIVFAINKIDKPGANPDRVREELAAMNYLVEEWGGKYQCQEISAKSGTNIRELLDKVLLEAEMLELKANPNKRATGSIIESSLDRGRGFVSTLLVQAGSLHVGDVVLAGQYFGHVKAMFNERNQNISEVGPSEPVLILGLNGAPQAGDKFNVMESEREARQIANKREQLQREQGLRTQKHITLDEIGRRIAIGNFQELNVIVKGDVDGSIEALSDSLIKLSTEEIQVNVIHKAVGQISESDVMLAAASNAIIVGFQVRPSLSARKLAEKEEIDIRLYSIIYNAIEEIRSAMEGMLSPEIKEEVLATLEIRETFKISKVGTIAGCMVKEGKINRNSKVRLIRDGIVIYDGELGSLKRYKDDVKEVATGYECGLNIANFNDIKTGDFIEAYHEVEVKKTL